MQGHWPYVKWPADPILLFQPLPPRQKHRQRAPRVLVRADDAMRQLQAAEKFLVTRHEGLETGEILFARRGWTHDAARAGFEVLKDIGLSERKFQFLLI